MEINKCFMEAEGLDNHSIQRECEWEKCHQWNNLEHTCIHTQNSV